MDGTDIRQIDPADLRRNVGYVSQDNYLFFGTVRDNIAFGAPHLDDAGDSACGPCRRRQRLPAQPPARLRPAGRRARHGPLGRPAPGHRDRPRAVARSQNHPGLDEPTSNMDNSTEAMFKKRLGEVLPDKTLLLVTHRSSLLTLVDRLLIVDGGKIVADGPKEDVLNALKQGQIRAANELKQ